MNSIPARLERIEEAARVRDKKDAELFTNWLRANATEEEWDAYLRWTVGPFTSGANAPEDYFDLEEWGGIEAVRAHIAKYSDWDEARDGATLKALGAHLPADVRAAARRTWLYAGANVDALEWLQTHELDTSKGVIA